MDAKTAHPKGVLPDLALCSLKFKMIHIGTNIYNTSVGWRSRPALHSYSENRKLLYGS
jgi:hypothetical protein